MKNYLLLGCAGMLATACQTTDKKTSEKIPESKEKQPNIILIVADDLGYNDLTCYRNAHETLSEKPPTAKTPHIDKLAGQGVRFTDFYCGSAVSSPSRSVILTGRNASRNGIYNWVPHNSPMHLRQKEVTIAEMLKEQNYNTGHFGKWHLTSKNMGQPLPRDHGYDYSFFTYNNAKPSHENPVNFFRNGDAIGEQQGFSCQLVMDEALSWLDKSKNDSVPFYINIWFNEPHSKVAAPDSLAQRHEYNQHYYGCIENMDIAVGRLMEYLEKNKLEENTFVLFSSDNGSKWPHSNDPLRGEKCFNFEGGIRVPFIVRWTGKIPAGKINNTPGSFADILPTVAEFTQSPLPENRKLDGTSLVQIFTGEKDSVTRQEPIFFYRYFHDPICMLRKGDWCLLGYENLIPYKDNLNESELANIKPEPGKKPWSQWGFQEGHMEYIYNQQIKHFELYNLREDKEQKNNLADKHPDRLEKMKQEMMQLREEMIQEGGNWFE